MAKVCVGSLNKLAKGTQSKMMGLREDKDLEKYSLIKDLNVPKVLLSDLA